RRFPRLRACTSRRCRPLHPARPAGSRHRRGTPPRGMHAADDSQHARTRALERTRAYFLRRLRVRPHFFFQSLIEKTEGPYSREISATVLPPASTAAFTAAFTSDV